jgi:hypothetical protein
VGVAQLVELLVVVQVVAGSSPVAHPSRSGCRSAVSVARRPVPRASWGTAGEQESRRLASSRQRLSRCPDELRYATIRRGLLGSDGPRPELFARGSGHARPGLRALHPIRTIQEFLGHADSKTTQIYAHYAPSEHEVQLVDMAFAPEAQSESVDDANEELQKAASPEALST